jgi:hypothetical protein
MSFTTIYSSILSPFSDSYTAAKNATNRATVIKNAVDAVVESRHLLEDTGIDLPKDLKQVCLLTLIIFLHCGSLLQAVTRYIKRLNEKEPAAQGSTQKPKKVKPAYTIRDVIKQHYKALVEAEIPYTPKDHEYIGSYQRAVTTVHQNMSEKEVEKAEEILERWNEEGASLEVQLK